MSDAVSGGIIDIEHSSDLSVSDPTFTVVGKTKGSISWSPNTDVAESSDDHSTLHADKAAVGAAWEVTFSGKILSTLGGLETLGLYDSTNEVMGEYVDQVPSDDEGLRITVYEDADAKDAGTVTLQIGPEDDYVLVLSDFSIEADGFSVWECTLHVRESPTMSTGGA